MNTSSTAAKNNDFFRANPVLRAKQKFDAFTQEDGMASYGGIFTKTGIFMGMTVLGYILFFALHKLIFSHMTPVVVGPSGEGMALAEVILLLVSVIAALVLGIIAGKNPARTAVLGSLYTALQGYFIASTVYMAAVISNFGQMAIVAASIALVITIIIVMLMAFLYMKRIVKATQRLKKTLAVAFPAMIILTVVGVVLSFIPATAPMMTYLLDTNPVFAIGLPLIGVVIATMTLISDFDAIEQVVEGNAPKIYEWTAAFGLAITVIWLYIKILRIVLKILALAKKR